MTDRWRNEERYRDRFGERGYRDWGRAYGRDYGSEGERYGGFQGPATDTYNPRSDYDRGPFPYSPEYGEGPGYVGGISYGRAPGDFGRPYRRRPDFRGRGPKGYVRPDDRIRDEVCDRLTDDPELDASDIEVKVDNGEVILSGLVDSRADKIRAEVDADEVSGVKDVQNLLRLGQGETATEAALAKRQPA